MTWADFRQVILQLGIPAAYDHFDVKQSPPYLAYRTSERPDLMADDTHYYPRTLGDLELYTKIKDLVTEKRIEDILDANKIPWGFEYETFLDSEGVFLVRWGFELMGG